MITQKIAMTTRQWILENQWRVGYGVNNWVMLAETNDERVIEFGQFDERQAILENMCRPMILDCFGDAKWQLEKCHRLIRLEWVKINDLYWEAHYTHNGVCLTVSVDLMEVGDHE